MVEPLTISDNNSLIEAKNEDCFNLPIMAYKYSQDVAVLSNIQKIELAEYYLKNYFEGTEQAAKELPLEHFICNKTYTRQITLPKDIILTGKVHNFDHTSIISKGDVTIMTPEGVTRIKAPATWISKAGTKRLIYVHEETIWATIHQSEHTIVEDLEKELVHESDLSWINKPILLGA
tara:strand:+ start:2114 stop:2644 length:531 start_codon:yes stop_codon:yes gene_type:complete